MTTAVRRSAVPAQRETMTSAMTAMEKIVIE